jgi:hypothetical protein
MVQNLRNFVSRKIASPSIKIKWKRPLATEPSDVKIYIVQRNNAAVYPVPPDGSRAVANIIGYVTNTELLDENPYVGENFYWVTPVNAAGLGVTSDAVMVISTKTNP